MRFFVFLLLGLTAAESRAESTWPEIAGVIKAYAASPSPATAKAAISAIPDHRMAFSNSPEEKLALDRIYAPGPMKVLKTEVLRRQRDSVELAFRMRNLSDGAFTEELYDILGKLIRIDPALFLTELQRANVSQNEIGGIAGFLGMEYVDRMARQCEEIHRRQNALKRVKEPALRQLKDEVILSLASHPALAFCTKNTPSRSNR